MMKEIKYTIEKKEAFNMIGYPDIFPCKEGNENYECIIQKWANLTDEKMQKLFPIMNGYIQAFTGVSNHIDDNSFQYTIAVSTDLIETNEFHITKFPAMNWIIIPCIGAISGSQGDMSFGTNSSAMVQLKNRILNGEINEIGFTHTNCPRIEIYYQGDMTSKDYISELWIPIKKIIK